MNILSEPIKFEQESIKNAIEGDFNETNLCVLYYVSIALNSKLY